MAMQNSGAATNKIESTRLISVSWFPWARQSFQRPVRLAYQPPANSTFLSEQTSHHQPANSTFLSEQTSTSHQPPAERTGCKFQ
jgi:hypothetical protein